MDSIAEGVLPTLLHIGLPFYNGLHAHHEVAARIELLHPGNAGSLHPIQIGLDAILGDVPIHPMPPDADPCILWRILKTFVLLCKGSSGKEQHPCQGNG